MKRVEIYDTTLRDGGQQRGISFTLRDKLEIAKRLGLFGVDYIELGWPGSNETDRATFEAAKRLEFHGAKIVAFGMTCAKGKKPEEDQQLAKLIAAGTQIITIVGKSSRQQVERTLGIAPKENLRMIEESCRFLASQGRAVFFDAEHFFDGYKSDCVYALECLNAAISGGASKVILCDTNGGSLPWEVGLAVSEVTRKVAVSIGIHAHNDGGMAVANSLAAVEAGADQVQVTINGYGERCGNANLCSVVPAIVKKMHLSCLCEGGMQQLTTLAHYAAKVANLQLNPHQPYVGKAAFFTKAGLHASAIIRDPGSYSHIDPVSVGNVSSVGVSELSGGSNVAVMAKEFGIDLSPEQVRRVLTQVKKLESQGFQFEAADASLRLIMMRQMSGYRRPFKILDRDINSSRHGDDEPINLAKVRLQINNDTASTVHEAGEGDGPVNALDNAMRKALLPHFLYLNKVKLLNHRSKDLPGKEGTKKVVRLLVDFSDGTKEWTTVGCSTDSFEASLQALSDGFEYAILNAR
jgi:2-isopropylmalate synthase